MKTFEQKPEKYWWTQSFNSMLYALREFSSVLIAIWAIYTSLFLIFSGFFTPAAKTLITIIGLTGAQIHTLTWLWVMPKLLPPKLSVTVHALVFAGLIIVWLALSVLLIIWF